MTSVQEEKNEMTTQNGDELIPHDVLDTDCSKVSVTKKSKVTRTICLYVGFVSLVSIDRIVGKCIFDLITTSE